MDNICQIMYETIRVSAPEFIRLLFAGMAGGLLGAYIADKLTRKREKESGISTRKRDFLTFIKRWRKASENIISKHDAIFHFPAWFGENVPDFCGFAETIRGDFTNERRDKFDAFASTISDSNWGYKPHQTYIKNCL